MLTFVLTQIALAASMLGGADTLRAQAATPTPAPHARAEQGRTERPNAPVTAGPRDKTALDILNDTRRDILGRGAARRCPPVKAVYVNGERRLAPAIDHGFSRATLYFAGDTVMIMLPPSVADALRTVPARAVRDIRYVDCRDETVGEGERNVLHVATK